MFRPHAVHPEDRELVRGPQRLAIRSERQAHVHVLHLIGELDMSSAQAFEDELKRVEATDAREIVVDLSGLEFIGSDGLKAFIHASARSRLSDNRLRLVRGPAAVQKTFETSGLVSRLPFADQQELRSPWLSQFAGASLVVSRPVQAWLT